MLSTFLCYQNSDYLCIIAPDCLPICTVPHAFNQYRQLNRFMLLVLSGYVKENSGSHLQQIAVRFILDFTRASRLVRSTSECYHARD